MGAPFGNQNGKRQRIWHAAIMRALETRDKSRLDGKRELDELASKLLDLVATGDLAALKEFGDRLDGKPATVIVGDADADPVQVEGRVRLVRPNGGEG